MIYTGLLSLLLAEYAANQKCSAVLLCSADSIYPQFVRTGLDRMPNWIPIGDDRVIVACCRIFCIAYSFYLFFYQKLLNIRFVYILLIDILGICNIL